MPGVCLAGIGANLACYGGVIPTVQTMELLLEVKEKVERRIGRKLERVSGGTSANLKMVLEQQVPPGITELRIGEGILLGNEAVCREPVPGCFDDAFLLKAEVIEVQRKPSKMCIRDSCSADAIRPEVEWAGDGYITCTLFIPEKEDVAEYAALEIAAKMGLQDPEVIHKRVIHPSEGTLVELKGIVSFSIDRATLKIPEKPQALSEDEIREEIAKRPLKVVCGTVGEDEHSVGMREIIDIKHGGIEGFGIKAVYLGTSVPVEKMIDAAIEEDAGAILISTIISHADIHKKNMERLVQLAVEKRCV